MATDIRGGIAQLATLHRDPEAAAAFTGPVCGGWRRLFGLLSSELPNLFLSAAQWLALEVDCYVTLNGMRPAKGRSRCAPFCDLRAGKRSDDDVTALNAVWVDFDCYKLGLTLEQVLAVLEALRDTEGLPPWSLVIHSGRGLWVVWLLRRDDSELPPKATDENKVACLRLNRALASRFDYLGADRCSTNLGRVTRVPGSTNSSAVSEGKDGKVRWDYSSPLPLYTIAEMSAAFPAGPLRDAEKSQEPSRRYVQTRSAWVDRGTYSTERAPRGKAFTQDTARAAQYRRWSAPAFDVLAVWVIRGGFKRGHCDFAGS